MDEMGSLQLLLKTIIDGQNRMSDRLDDMATREDVALIAEGLKDTVSKEEFEDLKEQFLASQRDKLPPWFWTSMIGFLTVIEPVGILIISHYWRG